MVLDFFLSNPTDFPHIVSATQHIHKIIINTETTLLIHCPFSNVFIAETKDSDFSGFIRILKTFNIVRLQTTNETLFNFLKSDFAVSYECVQATYPESDFTDSRLELISENDIPFASSTYGIENYIYQLYQRKRLFALYEKGKIAAYVAYHIDESVGALYVDPQFRKKGLGARLMKEAFKNYKEGIRYSQIVSDNIPSIKLHEKIGCKISSVPLFWVYDEDFIYTDSISNLYDHH